MLNYQTEVLGNNESWVVFIHGAGGSLKSWNYQKAALGQHHNLLMIDLRDHGASKDREPAYDAYQFSYITSDILEVIDHIGIRKAHFISLSFGSVLLQDLAMKRPGLLLHVVMAGGIFKGNLIIRSFVQLARIFNLFLSYSQMYRLFSYLLMPRKRNQKARRIYQIQSQKLTQEEYLKWVGLYGEFFRLLSRFYHFAFPTPTLIVMGKDDYIFLKGARDYARRHQHAKLVEIPATGHICNIERPAFFNQLVIDFLGASKATAKKPASKAKSLAN